MRSSLFVVAVAALAAAAACSSDSTPATGVPSATGTSTSANGISITADTTVPTANVVVGSVIPMKVRVAQNGTALTNTAVTWAVTSGGGSLSATSSATDATGTAAINWTVGDTAQANTITATVGGSTATITATTVAGAASSLVKVSPDSQAVVAGATLQLTARPVDRFGNPVSGVTVTWQATGGSFSATSTTSGASGNATANFITGPSPASYLVTAALAGKASVSFTVVGF